MEHLFTGAGEMIIQKAETVGTNSWGKYFVYFADKWERNEKEGKEFCTKLQETFKWIHSYLIHPSGKAVNVARNKNAHLFAGH